MAVSRTKRFPIEHDELIRRGARTAAPVAGEVKGA
jgi:hypothetical protein